MDLNKHFIAFAKDMTAKNPALCSDDHRVLDKLLFAWQTTKFANLDGKTPRAFVDSLPPFQLVDMLNYGENALVFEKIKNTADCAPFLCRLVEKIANDRSLDHTSCSALQSAITLISYTDTKPPFNSYVSLLKLELDDELKEQIIDALKLSPNESRLYLLQGIEQENQEFKTIAGEILLEGEKNEQTFELLIDLFLSGENVPLYASFLGKYGDERAASYLYKRLDSADYVDFLEVKNAIERLGGIVDDNLRDFSSDPLYLLIKESGKNNQ